MTREQYLKNLDTPKGKIDVVLDTDAYNEIDDQFAIAYMLHSQQKLTVKGICIAPFTNKGSTSEESVQKSHDEIVKVLKLDNKQDLASIVYKGSTAYLPDETTPVESDAAEFMANLANEYSPEKPLYIIAIGAITNVASAILKNPNVKENCVVVWLGGHAKHISRGASEYNMMQDIAAARVVFGCGVPLVQLPCFGVVDRFSTTKYELLHWLDGKSPLCDYLCHNAIRYSEERWQAEVWSKVIWDVTAIGWLLNEDGRFMSDSLIHSPIPQYDLHYSFDENRHFIKYVHEIKRDALFENLFKVLAE